MIVKGEYNKETQVLTIDTLRENFIDSYLRYYCQYLLDKHDGLKEIHLKDSICWKDGEFIPNE